MSDQVFANNTIVSFPLYWDAGELWLDLDPLVCLNPEPMFSPTIPYCFWEVGTISCISWMLGWLLSPQFHLVFLCQRTFRFNQAQSS